MDLNWVESNDYLPSWGTDVLGITKTLEDMRFNCEYSEFIIEILLMKG
jgi:hypothetical protein